MTDLIDIDGQCHCGEISLKAKVAPQMVVACHCTDCQTFSGGPVRMVAIVPADHFHMTGTPSEYVKTAESGNKRIQAFCGTCGSQLFAADAEKTTFNIRGGCLRQRDSLVPTKHLFGTSSAPWLHGMFEHAWVAKGPASEAFDPKSKSV